MKLKVRKTNSYMVYLPNAFFQRYPITNKKQNCVINGIPFSAKIIQNNSIKDKRVLLRRFITIPKKIAEYLKLQDKQEVEIEIR